MQVGINIDVNAPREGLTPRDILKALHDASDQLGLIEVFTIRDRTPVLTGALREGASYKGSKGNVGDGRLVSLYFDDEPQLFEWGRVYSPYQEGPPLGLSTYTNPPRQMLYQVATEDTEQIQIWAEGVIAELEARTSAERFAGTLEEALSTIFADWGTEIGTGF